MPTKIEWTDETWNPVTGCTPISAGCTNCYARRMARRLAGRHGYPPAPHHFDVTLHPDRLEQPLRWRKPRMVFVCSMSDLFHKDVSDKFVAQAWGMMRMTARHTFQVLTKRPERMLQFLKRCQSWEGWITHDGTPPSSYGGTGIVVGDVNNWPLANVWIGTTAENQKAADERIPLLLQAPAVIRFISCEPLLGPIDLFRAVFGEPSTYLLSTKVYGWPDFCNIGTTNQTYPDSAGISWTIVGGESGPNARPMHPDWARSLQDQCQAADVPFFFKQWGHYKKIQFDKRSKDDILVSPTRGVVDRLPSLWDDLDEAKRIVAMSPVGKSRAGRLLDGVEWNQIPEVSQ